MLFRSVSLLSELRNLEFTTQSEDLQVRGELSSWNVSGFGISGVEVGELVLVDANADTLLFGEARTLTRRIMDSWIARVSSFEDFINLASVIVASLVRSESPKVAQAVEDVVGYAFAKMMINRAELRMPTKEIALIHLIVRCASLGIGSKDGHVVWGAALKANLPSTDPGAGIPVDERMARAAGELAALIVCGNDGKKSSIGMASENLLLEGVASIGLQGTKENSWAIEAYVEKVRQLKQNTG